MASSPRSISPDEKTKEDEVILEAQADPSIDSPTTTQDAEKTPSTTPAPTAELDGGLRAWFQVVGSCLVFANLWGFTFAFGSFQSYFELHLLRSESSSNIAWIGTMQVFLLIFGGVLTGPFFDLGHYRTMLLAGAAIETIGVFMTSLCHEWYQFFLAQGVLMGLGCALLYIPGMALVGRAFKKNRAIALAVTTCGAPTGGIIYTLIFEQLIGRVGFGWTVRAMGFVMLFMYALAVPLCLFRVTNIGNLASGTKRKLLDLRAFTDLPFCWYTFANFLIFTGYMVPFNFMAAFGETSINLTQSTSLTVIIAAQASSIGGRLIAGWTARRVGVMIPWTTCAMMAGFLCIAWIGARAKASFFAVAALYGCFSGALIPLPPSVFPVVCPDPKVFGARLGMAQGISAFASLIGSPIGGALITTGRDGTRNFLGLQLFSGVAEIAGGCLLLGLWVLLVKRGRGGGTKWI